MALACTAAFETRYEFKGDFLMKKSILLSIAVGLFAVAPALAQDAAMQKRLRECGSLVTSLEVLRYGADRNAKEANKAFANYTSAKSDADRKKYKTQRANFKSNYNTFRGRISGLKGQYTKKPSCETIGKKVKFSTFNRYTKPR